jgi:hypothetical protein
MKTYNSLNNIFKTDQLDNSQLGAIRGGTSGGSKLPLDEDILLPDPEPGDENN